MAERPAATAPEPAAPFPAGRELAGRSVLLSTKLHPPGPRPDFLPRPRLAERLDEALGHGLVLVCAPAGYGKTSLLASWARHCQQPVAWLSLDASDKVLEHQPEQLRAFLLETSVLQRLSGPLCNAVTVRAGSQALLEQVERAGLFLLPLDEVRGWWRYHQLFADLLRARLEQQPDRAAQLHRNAAAWYADHELADDAIGHAVAAGEMTWAARLIEENFDERFYLHGEVSTVRRWLALLPPELAASRPRLLLARARLALLDGGLEEAEGLLDLAGRRAADADERFEPSAGRASSLLVNVPAAVTLLRVYLAELRGDAETTVDLVSRAMAASREGEAMLGTIIGWYAGMAEWLRGRPAEAERLLSPAVGQRSAAGEGFLAAWVCHVLCQAQRAQGQLDAVVRTCRRTLEITAPPGRPAALAAGAAYVNLGQDAYQRDELDTALRHVTAGIALCRQLAYPAPLAAGLVTLAWIRQAGGDQAGALDAIGEAGRFAPGPAVNGLLNPVPAERARLLLAQGDLAGAARWASEKGLGAGDEPRYPSEPEHLLLARVLLAQDRPGPALELLDRLYASAVAQDRIGSVIEAGALRALALAASGQAADAVTALAGVLTLAGPRGYARVFADEGPPMAALLGQVIAAQRTGRGDSRIPIGYLARLNRAFDTATASSAPRRGGAPSAPGIVEPLTNRELEVLQMLAAGQSNQAIAGELVVTLDTVKKHVSHLLGKLGAANRTEAVARARELGLIS